MYLALPLDNFEGQSAKQAQQVSGNSSDRQPVAGASHGENIQGVIRIFFDDLA